MRQFFNKLFGPKREINYLYFSSFLFFLSLLSVALSQEGGISFFFLLYAIGQALFEVCLFVLVAYLLMRWAPRWAFLCFISVSFVLMLLHYTHFLMVRVMDASLGYIFKFFLGSGIDHIVAGFQALNMNVTMIGITIGTVVLIPLAGLGFYWLTSRASQRKPLHLSLFQIIATLGAVACSLFLLDLIAYPFLNPHAYSKYQKRLPLGITFLPPSSKQISLSEPLALPRNEEQISFPALRLPRRPNIYLFVIETLRRDFVTQEIAPHLTSFGDTHIQFPRSFANANATYLSWFAIFHSDIPLHWAQMRDSWREGSIPLRYLKELGYKIHVYSSADLRYFNMDRLLFGENRKLASHIEEYMHSAAEPCERDALAMNALKRDLAREGHVYLIFLDSPHSEYSFPKDFPVRFEPIAKEIDYLTIKPKSPELELIKNRYRNSIHYVDQLMGDFFAKLKQANLFNNAIIAITGDHGEEFFEEGALFHGTHLNHYQTSVPLLLKFPTRDWIPQTQLATHMDIFPSILHYLTKRSDLSTYCDGQSIFSLDHTPYHIAVLQNGPHPPVEFSLSKPDFFLRARILDRSHLEIIELQGELPDEALKKLF